MFSGMTHDVLRIPARALIAVTAEPAEIWNRISERVIGRRERLRPRCEYQPVSGWEAKLHQILAVPWPCPLCAGFDEVWTTMAQSLQARGLSVGPMTFGPWNVALSVTPFQG